jgi:L1 cell adhesion molecule like protein
MESIGIGIDLGTTNSCIAFWRQTGDKENAYQLELVVNELGSRITPSVVSFTKKERIVGQNAKEQIAKNAENTIYDVKRLIGRKFNDPCVQEDMKLWPFKVIKDPNSDYPLIEITFKGEKKHFKPEEISSMILSKLKVQAENYLNHKVERAIITCPAYFNENQRDSTQLAAKLAGLEVNRIINEPTAAAIAYGFNSDFNNGKHVLVFDLGGGTFDVSVLTIDKEIIEVRSTCGNTHLGGEDFDNELLKYCLKKFKENTGIDASKNAKAIRRLKNKCEKAKMELSSTLETSIDIDSFCEGNDLSITIMRIEFEELCKNYFEMCFPCIDQALKDAILKKEQIDDIVLIGGSSRIPKIQEMIKEYFGKEPKKNIHPEEAVALGAAIQSAICENIEEEGLEKLMIIDLTPLSIGFALQNGEMFVLIERNTSIPTTNSHLFQTPKDNTEKILIEIYQGERKLAKENEFLGKTVINLPKRPKGLRVIVSFSLDISGILSVSAYEEGKTEDKSFQIDIFKNSIPENKIKKMVEEALLWEKEDLKRIENITIRNNLQSLGFDLKNSKNKELSEKGIELVNWVKKNKEQSTEVYLQKMKEYEKYKIDK